MEKILDKETQNKVREILEKLTEPVQLLLFKNDGEYSEIVEQLLEELRELDDRIKVDARHSDSQEINNYDIEKDLLPAMLILDNEGRDYRIRYYGIPSGYEFATFLQNIIAVSNKTVDSFNNENKEKLILSSRNIKRTKVLNVDSINVYDLVRYENIYLTKSALKKIEEVYSNAK
ncbi:MAG: Glutaredoxin-like domain protein [Petrotoga mobilis]|nr:MAG: Glutaredoxin-like domain protein [Petrotoga mobilis]